MSAGAKGSSSTQGVDGFHVVIPARFESTRLPGKPLVDIDGVPMVVRVAQVASKAGALDVTIATDDQRVAEAVRAAGFVAELTAASHASGSDRIFEVVQKMGWGDDEVVLNVQGDEPLLPSTLVAQVGECLLAEPGVAVCTLREPIDSASEMSDPNCVKVVVDKDDQALLFSRASIPHRRRDVEPGLMQGALGFRHIGLYGYRVAALRAFVGLSPSLLERQESLEQLRLLENGIAIKVLEAREAAPGGVDTPEDLARVRALLAPS